MILSIDLGSTTFKAAVFDRQLRERRFAGRPVVYRYTADGRVELPVSRVESALREALTEAVAGLGDAITAVAITSQAQTFTVLDSGRRGCLPFISWRDNRPAAVRAVARLNRILPDFAEHAGFGTLLPALQIAQLAALRLARNQIPLPLPSYLNRLLTGEIRIDANQAAMTGLYSLTDNRWHPPALSACGLKAAQLPGVIPLGTVGGLTARGSRRFGLPPGIPVVLAGNDQTAGAYGAEIERHAGVLLTLGTAIAVYACSDTLPAPSEQRIRGPYPGNGFYRMTADSCGGALINWGQAWLAGCGNDEAFFAAAATAPPGARGLRFKASTETGGGDWLGGRPGHLPSDFARALLEELTRRIADRVRDLDLVPPPSTLQAAGGGSRRALWTDMIARETGSRVIPTRATALRGAARMALTCSRRK